MTARVDSLIALISASRGARPASLHSVEAEEVLSIALSLVVELAAANSRIDNLERIVAAQRGQPVETLRNTAYDGADARARQDDMEALFVRALYIMLDPRQAATNASGADRAG